MVDVYRYTITLKGNYQGVVVKDIKKNEVTDKENEHIQGTEEYSKVQDIENKKQNVQTGYKQTMQLYGLLAVSSLIVAGLSYFLRKRKVK